MGITAIAQYICHLITQVGNSQKSTQAVQVSQPNADRKNPHPTNFTYHESIPSSIHVETGVLSTQTIHEVFHIVLKQKRLPNTSLAKKPESFRLFSYQNGY